MNRQEDRHQYNKADRQTSKVNRQKLDEQTGKDVMTAKYKTDS